MVQVGEELPTHTIPTGDAFKSRNKPSSESSDLNATIETIENGNTANYNLHGRVPADPCYQSPLVHNHASIHSDLVPQKATAADPFTMDEASTSATIPLSEGQKQSERAEFTDIKEFAWMDDINEDKSKNAQSFSPNKANFHSIAEDIWSQKWPLSDMEGQTLINIDINMTEGIPPSTHTVDGPDNRPRRSDNLYISPTDAEISLSGTITGHPDTSRLDSVHLDEMKKNIAGNETGDGPGNNKSYDERMTDAKLELSPGLMSEPTSLTRNVQNKEVLLETVADDADKTVETAPTPNDKHNLNPLTGRPTSFSSRQDSKHSDGGKVSEDNSAAAIHLVQDLRYDLFLKQCRSIKKMEKRGKKKKEVKRDDDYLHFLRNRMFY